MNKKTLIAVGLGLVQLTLFGKIAFAQDAEKLKEVVISTTKNDQKQSQTGKVVTVITADELSKSSGRNLAELLNLQAGVNVVGAGSNAGKEKSVFFRGAASAYTVILIDGVLATDPSGTGAFDLRLLAIDQIERVEILRGGQSTIYGSDAVAGVINIITKKDGVKGNNVYGVATGGSYDTYKGQIGLSSKIDNFTYNLSYSHLRTDGISEAANPPSNSQQFDKDGVKQDALNANFSFKLDKRLSLNPFLRYFEGKFDYDDNAFTDANNTSTSKNLNAGLNAIYLLDEGKLTLNYSHQNTKRNYISQYGGNYEGKMDLVDLFYSQNLNEKLNLLLGIENRATAVTQFNASGLTQPSANLFSSYASLFLHDLSIFNVEIGGRYNKHNKYGENFTYAVSPSINVTNQIKLFGTLSSSFRAPTLDMLFGQFGANLNLKPEKAINYEVGTTLNFFNNIVNLRVVGFKRNMDDAIIYGANGYINQNEQNDRGFEIEPGVTFKNVTINGYYAYVEGKQINENLISDVLLRRPKNTYGINAGLQVTSNLYLSANYKFTGDRIDSDFSSFPSVNKVLDSYQLFNFYTEYAFAKKRIRVFVDLKNITNERYTEIIGYSTMGFNMNTGITFNFK